MGLASPFGFSDVPGRILSEKFPEEKAVFLLHFLSSKTSLKEDIFSSQFMGWQSGKASSLMLP